MLGTPCISQYEIYPISGYFSKFGAHQTMLMDKERVEGFKKILRQKIIPGKSIVMDIGTGTGILSLFAAQLGAKKVYAVEMNTIANLAKKIIRINGYSEVIEVIRAHSSKIHLKEKVDIIVSETIGLAGFEENTADILKNAKRQFGHYKTTVIPERLKMYITPCSDTTIYDKILKFWKKKQYGFNYLPICNLAQHNIYGRMKLDNDQFLSEPKIVEDLKLGDDSLSGEKHNIEFIIQRDGMLTGLAGWFECELAENTVLSSLDKRNHWQQIFFPLPQPQKINKGYLLDVDSSIHLYKEQVSFSWRISNAEREQTTDQIITYSQS